MLALATGCALPVDITPEAVGVRLTAERGEEGQDRLVLHNDSDQVLLRNVTRLEAQEVDGSFTLVEERERLSFQPREQFSVGPGESFELGPVGHDGIFEPRPGTYRRTHAFELGGEVHEVAIEFATVGWSDAQVLEAGALAARAEELECVQLGHTIERALLHRLEPDPLVSLHRRREGRARTDVAIEMVERGGFEGVLLEELTTASLGAVRPIASELTNRAEMRTLRAEAALRMSELLVQEVPIEDRWDLVTLAQLASDWSETVLERLLERIRTGPEEGEVEIELIDTLVYADGELLDPNAEDILAAADVRCEGATDALAGSCERLRARFAPGLHGGFGRGWGSSSCGGFFLDPPPCTALYREWNTFLERAGEPETIVL